MRKKSIDLTIAEKEVMKNITEDFLTLKQIRQLRKCSLQAVYKIIKKLKQKGAIDNSLNKVENNGGSNPKGVRLHAQEFNIQIKPSQKYLRSLRKSNVMFLGGNTIRLYSQSLEIYSGHSFMGKTAQEAYNHSIAYWTKFLARLTHELDIDILKDRYRIIREVNHHFARGDSEIAEDSLENNNQIRIYAYEDGKLWFLTDDSFGFKEDETVHPITAKEDREAIDKQLNDWRANNPPTISQIVQIQAETAQNLNLLAKTMGEYGTNIKAHTKSIIALSKAIPQLVNMLKETKQQNESLKQRRLTEW